MKGRISLLILLVVILVTLTSCGSGTKKGSKELQQLREQVKTLQEENSELQKENITPVYQSFYLSTLSKKND